MDYWLSIILKALLIVLVLGLVIQVWGGGHGAILTW